MSVSARAATAPDDVVALQTLARLAVRLSPQHLLDSLDDTCANLRQAVGAATVGVYLAAARPSSGHGGTAPGTSPGPLTLASLSPLHAREPARVVCGEGAAGLAAARCRTLLGRARRRNAVRVFIAVPLLAEDTLLGVLQACWQQSEPPPATSRHLLEQAAIPMATAILAAQGALRSQVAAMFRQRDDKTPLATLLDEIRRLAACDGAMLAVNGTRQQAGCAATCAPASSGRLQDCPLWGQSEALVLRGAKDSWPRPCSGPHADTDTAQRLCLPILRDGEFQGVLGTSYATAPLLATRHEAVLEWVLAEAAWFLPAPAALATAVKAAVEPEVRISCLGGVRLQRDWRAVPLSAFKRKSALDVLKLLLLSAPRAVHRDVLCESLWPGAPLANAVNQLHGSVHALRHVLEPGRGRHSWRCIVGNGDHYRVDTQHCQIDFIDFLELAEQGRELETAGALAEALVVLEQACALYVGDLFADDPCWEACWSQRDWLREQYLEVLVRQSRLFERLGDHERSVSCLRQAVRIEPLREDLQRSLITALWQLGRRSEALGQYEACRELLRRELDTTPLAETEALHDDIVSSL